MLSLRFISWKFHLHGLGRRGQEAGRKRGLTPGQFQPRVSGSGSLLLTPPGCLSVLPGSVLPRASLSPSFQRGRRGHFGVSHLCCLLEGSSALDLPLGPAEPGARPGEAVAVGLPHSSAPGQRQLDHSFFWKLLDWGSWKGARSSSHLHPVSLQAESLCSRAVSISSVLTHPQ